VVEVAVVEEFSMEPPVSSVGQGYGFTHGNQATGATVTGMVPDFNTRSDTVPIIAVSRYCTYTLSGPDHTTLAT
jgi:hypothetical protein